MAKLGGALMVLGGLMFTAFFFGIAWGMATPGDVSDHQAFRDSMNNHSRVAGVTFAVSVAGMLIGIGGAVMVAMSRGRQMAALAEEEEASPSRCTHCGARLRPAALKCRSCGAPA
jgi:ribosomal protein L40E